MIPISSSLIPTFRINEQITAAALRDDRGVETELQEIRETAEQNREGLIGGRTEVGHLSGVPQNLGTFLAMALVRGDRAVAEDIGLLWINRCDQRGNPVYGLVEALYDQGRVDLVRPGLLLLHDLCAAIWNKRQAPRSLEAKAHPAASASDQSDFILRSEHLPDLMNVSEAQYNQITWPNTFGGTNAAQGAAAWGQIGRHFSETVRQWSQGCRLSLLAPLVLDVITTIPGVRAWACDLFLQAVQAGGVAGWGPQMWTVMEPALEVLLEQTNDKEAAVILGRIADVGRTLGTTIEPQAAAEAWRTFDRLAARLVGAHPQVSLDHWLAPPETLTPRLNKHGNGWNQVRAAVMQQSPTILTNGDDGRPTTYPTKRSPSAPSARDPLVADTYELIALWVGPSRGGEMSPSTYTNLRRFLDRDMVRRLHLPALRSALDCYALSQAPTNASPDCVPIGRKRLV